MNYITFALRSIFLAGLLSGVLDLACSSFIFRLKGIGFQDLLRRIAGGLMGEKAFRGGGKTAFFGVLIHFAIAFTAAAFYYIATRWLPFRLVDAVIAGMLYGLIVHLVMTFAALPLSALPRRPFDPGYFILQAFVHMFFVGLPIALVVYLFG